MDSLLNHPLIVLLVTFLMMWLVGWLGARISQRRRDLTEDTRSDFGVAQGATLTLLGLLIGFSFSMATGRYDQRKNYEENEANAIGTEYVRADLLPDAAAGQVRTLLRQYTDLRIRWYAARDADEVRQIDLDTAKMQDQLWKTTTAAVNVGPTPVMALAVGGMNDVLNSQGYTQAAWWNRIPVAAWCLMFAIALFCNWLLGYGVRKMEPRLLMILPLAVAVSLFLIADIDSPRGGVILVRPQNLLSLQAGLH